MLGSFLCRGLTIQSPMSCAPFPAAVTMLRKRPSETSKGPSLCTFSMPINNARAPLPQSNLSLLIINNPVSSEDLLLEFLWVLIPQLSSLAVQWRGTCQGQHDKLEQRASERTYWAHQASFANSREPFGCCTLQSICPSRCPNRFSPRSPH